MRYGEIFELTGKGDLPSIRASLYQQSKKVYNDLKASEDNDGYDEEGILNPPSEETKSLRKLHAHLTRRHRQAAHLSSSETNRYMGDDNNAIKNLHLAQEVRQKDRIKNLDPAKPDDWMKLKMMSLKDGE